VTTFTACKTTMHRIEEVGYCLLRVRNFLVQCVSPLIDILKMLLLDT